MPIPADLVGKDPNTLSAADAKRLSDAQETISLDTYDPATVSDSQRAMQYGDDSYVGTTTPVPATDVVAEDPTDTIP